MARRPTPSVKARPAAAPRRRAGIITPAAIFAAVLRETRETRHLPLTQLASALSVRPDILSDWEAATRSPRLTSAIAWAGALGLRLELVAARRL